MNKTDELKARIAVVDRELAIAQRDIARKLATVELLRSHEDGLHAERMRLQGQLEREGGDGELQWHCECGHSCHFNELRGGKCPRCHRMQDGVLVIAAPMPRGHCVVIDGPEGAQWRV